MNITHNPKECARLNVAVSHYPDHKTPQGEPLVLSSFLAYPGNNEFTVRRFRDYRNKLACMVAGQRLEKDKAKADALAKEITEYKKQFKLPNPCVTPGGLYPTQRTAAAKDFTPSGLLCLDIDRKDNPQFDSYKEWARLPLDLANSQLGQYICYIGESASGFNVGGYFVLFAIPTDTDAERYKRLYLALCRWFDMQGVKVDKAAANINHCRAMAYQDSAANPNLPLVNTEPQEWTTEYNPKPKKPKRAYFDNRNTLDSELQRAADCVNDIISAGVDLTANFDDWTALAFAFAYTFGRQGEPLFVALSSLYPKFNERETVAKYNNAMNQANGKITIATFWDKAQAAGFSPRNYKAGKP